MWHVATDMFTVTLIVSLSLMYLGPGQINVSEIFIYSKTVFISSISKPLNTYPNIRNSHCVLQY